MIRALRLVLPLAFLALAGHFQVPYLRALFEWLRLGADFHQYYFGLQGLRAGVCIYDDAAYFAFCRGNGTGHEPLAIYNPPAFFLLLEPFGQLDFLTSYRLFVVSSAVFLGVALLAMAWYLVPHRGLALATGLLAWVAMLVSPNGIDNSTLGQLGFWLTGCLVFAWLASQRGRPGLSGFFLAWAVLLKMWPLLLVVFFARHRRWREIAWTLGFLAFFSALQLARLGLPLHLAWLEHFQTAGLASGVQSQSIIGVAVTWTSRAILPTARALSLVVLVVGVAVLWRSASTATSDRLTSCLEYSAYLVLALVVSAWNWSHHRLVLMIPLLALAVTFWRSPWRGPWLSGLVALCAFWPLDGEIVQFPWFAHVHALVARSGMGLVSMVVALWALVETLQARRDPPLPPASP